MEDTVDDEVGRLVWEGRMEVGYYDMLLVNETGYVLDQTIRIA
jgi:hypothetical protein